MINLLLIDDDSKVHKLLNMILPDEYELFSAYTGEQGLEMLNKAAVDAVLLDIDLPDIDGIEVLQKADATNLPPVIMLTAYGDINLVVDAVKAGAYDYITKPFNQDKLEGTIKKAIKNSIDIKCITKAQDQNIINNIIGTSEEIKKIRKLVLKYATVDFTVLIQGASGTGKELVAHAIHAASHRTAGNFLAINCGAIPETLFEAELFGVEKGAYTDARPKPGKFELADNSTLFLDEVGEMPLNCQQKLLRVLEEKTITRVGGSKRIPIDVRIIAATNKDLKKIMQKKEFREDLYFRLAVLPIEIPGLQQRMEDIPLLALYFLKQLSHHKKRLGSNAREKLISYSWPGNIRELRNVMERAVLMAEGAEIRAKDITF